MKNQGFEILGFHFTAFTLYSYKLSGPLKQQAFAEEWCLLPQRWLSAIIIIYFFVFPLCRNSGVAQEIVEQIQKLLNTRVQQKPRSVGNGQEYVCVGEEHFRRRDFKKAVISFSLVMDNTGSNQLVENVP